MRIKKVIPKGKEATPIWLNHRCITRTSFQAIGFVETAFGERYLCPTRIQEPEDIEQLPSTEPNQGVEIMSITPPQQEQGESQMVLHIQSDPSNQQNEISPIHHDSTTSVPREETHPHVDSMDVGAQHDIALPLLTKSSMSCPHNPPHGHNEAASDRGETCILEKLLDEIGKLNERVGQLEAQQKNDHEEIMQKLESLQQKPS